MWTQPKFVKVLHVAKIKPFRIPPNYRLSPCSAFNEAWPPKTTINYFNSKIDATGFCTPQFSLFLRCCEVLKVKMYNIMRTNMYAVVHVYYLLTDWGPKSDVKTLPCCKVETIQNNTNLLTEMHVHTGDSELKLMKHHYLV